ncbi:MAG: FIST C-terminal domain-containing protein [Chitinophagaceae bacterium]|nr:FIST C-terminal domain-containing protein [Chitinophagaceae bacterium]
MKAKSIKGKTAAEIKTELEASMADGFTPTLAIVFLSLSREIESVSGILDDKGITIYGATTHGEFIDEELGKESIAILLLDINRDYFMVMLEEFPEKNYREVTQAMAKKAMEKFATPAFLIAGSNMETDAEQLLFGFEDIVGKQVNVYGGMAGDNVTFTEQFVFTNGKSSNRGIVAIVLDEEKIKIKGVATCGWKAMGTAKTVTKSEGNRLYTIDDIPVLELTKKYSGIENVSKENNALAIEIATNFPLQLQREKGAPVMRPGLLINWEDGSFICSGSVPQGGKVRFSLPPDLDVIDKVIEGVEKLKATEMPEADAMIMYSCAGRLVSMGPLMSTEIEGVKKVWNVPMVGLFSNAELARATDGNLEMHNLTTCCVALKEK